jgi:hypothetical protein
MQIKILPMPQNASQLRNPNRGLYTQRIDPIIHKEQPAQPQGVNVMNPQALTFQ